MWMRHDAREKNMFGQRLKVKTVTKTVTQSRALLCALEPNARESSVCKKGARCGVCLHVRNCLLSAAMLSVARCWEVSRGAWRHKSP